MLMSKNRSKNDDMDYDYSADPKRKNYKKIKLQIKKSMIHDFYEDDISISILTKKYHLSYSTIAHILKVYKEKNSIFESKQSKDDRQIDQSIQRQRQIKSKSNGNEGDKIKVQPPPFVYYPFFPEWSYILQ